MPQSLGADRPLPRQRAFVMQLQAQTDATPERFAGRVEHVISGQAVHFHSLDECLAFIARVLAHLPPPQGYEACHEHRCRLTSDV